MFLKTVIKMDRNYPLFSESILFEYFELSVFEFSRCWCIVTLVSQVEPSGGPILALDNSVGVRIICAEI